MNHTIKKEVKVQYRSNVCVVQLIRLNKITLFNLIIG